MLRTTFVIRNRKTLIIQLIKDGAMLSKNKNYEKILVYI